MMSVLSERLRPDVECAPWVIEEVRKLEAVLAKLREQEPQDRERWLAVREGHFNAASAEYFNARQHLDTPENRRIFYAGHCKGYDAAPLPAVVQVPLSQSAKLEMWKQATIEQCSHEGCYLRGIADAEAAYGIAAAPEAPAPRKKVGDSRFESWFSEDFDPKNKGTKQQMREAYEAGMNDAAPEAPAQDMRFVSGGVFVPHDIAWGIVGSTGHARKRVVDALHALLKAAPEAPATAVVQVPKGWRVRKGNKDGEFLVERDGLGFYVAKLDGPDIASMILARLASDMLAAAPEAPAQGMVMFENCDNLPVAEHAALKAAQANGFGPKLMPQVSGFDQPAQAIPAPWREAVKVAREALAKVDTACSLIPEDLEGYLEPLSEALFDARAALAQLDALEGGE